MDINLRIKKISYEKIKSIKTWYVAKNKKNINYKELVDYILNGFIKYEELDYIQKEDISDEIQTCNQYIKYFRIDNNFDPYVYEKIEAVKQYFEKKDDKKTINEVVDYSLSLVFDLYPEINEILEKNRITKQKKEIKKAIEKKRIEKGIR